jgi:hypothetical protein
VGRELVGEDLYDFLLFSLPDNDHHTHTGGIDTMQDSLAHADHCFGILVDAAGGMRAFLEAHAVILLADHAQTDVKRDLPIAAALGSDWLVLEPNSEHPERAEVAVSPTARAAGIYLLMDEHRRPDAHARIRARLGALEGVDLVAWRENGEAAVASPGGELRFAPGSGLADRRGAGWDLDGDPGVLGIERRDGRVGSDLYPDALSRLWSALVAPHAGDILVSLAPGFECVDWGGASHLGGASHGSLAAGDSLAPLVLCGIDPELVPDREQWALRDVAELVLAHFGVPAPEAAPAVAPVTAVA